VTYSDEFLWESEFIVGRSGGVAMVRDMAENVEGGTVSDGGIDLPGRVKGVYCQAFFSSRPVMGIFNQMLQAVTGVWQRREREGVRSGMGELEESERSKRLGEGVLMNSNLPCKVATALDYLNYRI
jgi:hypothetical protein